MVQSELRVRAANDETLHKFQEALRNRSDTGDATGSRQALLDFRSGDETLYLRTVRRQMQERMYCARSSTEVCALLWVSLWVERQLAGGVEVSEELVKTTATLRSYEFPLTRLLSHDSHGIVARTYKAHGEVFTVHGFVNMFQVHNAMIELDPGPAVLRACVEAKTNDERGGGLMCLVLFVASGRSTSIANLMMSGAFNAAMLLPWAQSTLDHLRYLLLDHKETIHFAEGSTNEVRRMRRVNHVNYGAHSDWIRDLMTQFPDEYGESLLVDFMTTFHAISNLTGFSAFRALHITLWLFIAYDVKICIPRSRLQELSGPNVKKLEDMCALAGTTLLDVYDAVCAYLPDMDPASFEIWSCKVVNFLYILHLQKQASLMWRRSLDTHTEPIGSTPRPKRRKRAASERGS